jgi:hypothetical protein
VLVTVQEVGMHPRAELYSGGAASTVRRPGGETNDEFMSIQIEMFLHNIGREICASTITDLPPALPHYSDEVYHAGLWNSLRDVTSHFAPRWPASLLR